MLTIREDDRARDLKVAQVRRSLGGPRILAISVVGTALIIVVGVLSSLAGRPIGLGFYPLAVLVGFMAYWMRFLFAIAYRFMHVSWRFEPDRIIFRGGNLGSMKLHSMRTAYIFRVAELPGYRWLAVGDSLSGAGILVGPDVTDDEIRSAIPQSCWDEGMRRLHDGKVRWFPYGRDSA